MLCSLNNRPDKLLQKKLLELAYSIVALILSIIAFMIYPEHFIYTTICILLFSFLSLFITLKTMQAAEESISYGGFANQIIKDSTHIKRIDNSKSEPVLQNSSAKDFFKNKEIMKFLEKHLSDTRSNTTAFAKLKSALDNLKKEKVELALNINSTEEWLEVNVAPIYLKKTEIFDGPFSIKKILNETYIFWTIKNLTASKNISQLLEDERKSLHDFLDYLPIPLYVYDKNYTLEYINHRFAELFGLTREELLQKDFSTLLAKHSPLPEKSEKWQGKIFIKTKSDNIIESFVINENFRQHQKIKTRGALITELPTDQELQNNLDSALDQLSWLFNFAPVSILFINKNGNIEDSNNTAQTILSINADSNIFDQIKSDDIDKLKKEINAICNKKKAESSIELTLNNSRTAILYLSPMRKLRTKGSNDSVVAYLIDTTEQKNLELQFAQAQKMQAMGQLAGGVAHDFNNLLTAMIGFADLLLQRHGVGDPSFADLIQIKNNANRAAGLVRQLLAFSRKQPLKPKLIDVTENFVELSHMLKRILGEQVKLEFNHGNDLGFIRVDPVQFSQVIINLAVNAKDAMNNNGILSINTHTENLHEPYQFGADTIQPGDFVVIDVKDNGSGIKKEHLGRIFEPFFSTKQNVVGSGTGLGLSMVYGIVRQTEGFIKVNSATGKGTTFSIYLPRFESNTEELITIKAEPATEHSSILTVQKSASPTMNINQKPIFGLNVSSIDRSGMEDTKNIRILFVEDEDSVRAFAVRALKKKGYDVVECNSAENALEQLESDHNFNLMITDMVMPGISGTELAKIVKEKIPAIKIILASGYSEEIARQELKSTDNFEFMAKPFSLGDLTKKVFDVLSIK